MFQLRTRSNFIISNVPSAAFTIGANRRSQIITLVFMLAGSGFLLLDYLAMTEGEPMAPKTQQNESSSQSGSSSKPNADQFRYRKRIRSTSVGRPN